MLSFVQSLTKKQKRIIMLSFDAVLLILAVVASLALRGLPAGFPESLFSYLSILPYVLLAGAAASIWLGVCSIQLNAYETAAVGATAVLSVILATTSFLASWVLEPGYPFGLHVILGAFFFSFVVISRALLLQVVLMIYRKGPTRCRVLIYGAGTTGTQLVSALRGHQQIEPIAFVDDNVALQGLRVAKLPVYSPMRVAELVAEKQIDRVLLAVPSLSAPKQAQIARRLEKMRLEVQTLPSFAQLIGEEALVDKLAPVAPRRFLNRDEVTHANDHGAAYSGKVVFVSGAGGSIGSEISRQVLEQRPTKLVLFELSELALYNTDMEMRQLAEGSGIEVVSVLGTVTDSRQLRKVLSQHKVNVILHAAAYKHVPLVEANPLSGLVNNVLGTQALAEQAARAGVERFILISTDKAVRPTNIMGGSKRLAELVLQDMARKYGGPDGVIFSMVRFGNVLGSSGSVVPLFQEQLSRGGPLTVTDRGVARYFMTVEEAVQLVLQAGAQADGGEVFVLDMGKPVPILRLARQVIETAGYTVRDEDNPDGDIEIAITGLRPGEKMTEELTLSGTLIGTRHPKIFSTREEGLNEVEIAAVLRDLREAVVANDEELARAVVYRWVEGFEAPEAMRKSS